MVKTVVLFISCSQNPSSHCIMNGHLQGMRQHPQGYNSVHLVDELPLKMCLSDN